MMTTMMMMIIIIMIVENNFNLKKYNKLGDLIVNLFILMQK